MDSQFILEASFDVGLSFCDTGVGGMQLTIVLVYFLYSGNRDNSSSAVTRKCLMYEFCDPASFTVGFWACGRRSWGRSQVIYGLRVLFVE